MINLGPLYEKSNLPLPKPPTAEAAEGYKKLLAAAQQGGARYLGFACVHSEPAQEVTVLQPDFADIAKAAGVGAIVLEQDKRFTDAVDKVRSTQQEGPEGEAATHAQMTGVVQMGYRTDYKSLHYGAVMQTIVDASRYLAAVLMHAGDAGIIVAGVDRTEDQIKRAREYFAISDRDPPVPPVRRDEFLTVFENADLKDKLAIRAATGFRDDAESADQIVELAQRLGSSGISGQMILGTHGALHLSSEGALDSLLSQRGITTAKVIALTAKKDLVQLCAYYATVENEMDRQPTTVFCFEDGKCYDSKSGLEVEATPERLSILRPGDVQTPRAAPKTPAAPLLVPPPPGS